MGFALFGRSEELLLLKTISGKLDALASSLNQLVSTSKAEALTIMTDLTALTAAVANDTSIDQSAITLIEGLASQITAAGTDPVALAALTTQLTTNAAALAAAVAANTAAAAPPASAPVTTAPGAAPAGPGAGASMRGR